MIVLETGAVIAIIVALVQVAKTAGLPSRFAPLLSLGVGILYGIAGSYLGEGLPLVEGIMAGVVMGLSASGLYSGGKTLVK